MKKTIKLLALLIALLMVMSIVLVACDNGDDDDGEYTGTFMELDDYKAYLKHELKGFKDSIGSIGSSIDAQITAAYNAGLTAIDAGTDVQTTRAALDNAKKVIANCIPLANGTFDFTGLSTEQRTEILGLLEAYAIREGLTGVSFYTDGAYVIYNDRVHLGTENYITNYGFGVLAEGYLDAPLESESNQAWKMYYHTINAQNPQHMNYLNDKGSETSSFYGYIAASYFTTFMNDTKDDYEWVTELAASMPEPVGELNSSGQTDHWRFELRQDLKYSTLSTATGRGAFNGRAVQLEDFITPFKLLLNAGNDYLRGEEMSTATGASLIVGANTYYNSTKSVNKKGILTESEAKFEDVVKIKAYEEGDKWYLEYTLGAPVNAENARYRINSSLYMPIPAEFIELVGVNAYLGNSTDGKLNPVDNSLSLGPYTLERWEDMQIVYKKNTNYVHSAGKYQIEGLHIRIFPAALEDVNAAFEYFLDGNTDAGTVSPAYVNQYKGDPRTREVPDSSVFKLNFNALDQETWLQFFGEDGSVKKTPANKYWTCEPAMNNSFFRSALSYSINRLELAGKTGRLASLNFFANSYISDTENGISYNSTEAHEKAIAQLLEGTDDGGYSLELARDYFRMALDELEAAGKITRGTKSNPTVINIQIAWQTAADEESLHAYVKQYWEDAFNDNSVHGGCYKLNVEFWVGNVWSDAYYEKMLVGQFDVGMGSIDGSLLDPLGYMEVLSSDPTISGGFTLNWAIDTNDPNAGLLVYNGMRWSYDALLESTQKASIVENGKLGSLFTVTPEEPELDDETVTFELVISWADGVEMNFDEIDFWAFGYDEEEDYDEGSILEFLVGEEPVIDTTARTATFTFTVDLNAEIGEYYGTTMAELIAKGTFGIDLYVGWTFQGIVVKTDFYNSYYFEF